MNTSIMYCVYSPQTKVFEFRCLSHMHNWMWDVSIKYLVVTRVSKVTSEKCVVCTGRRDY